MAGLSVALHGATIRRILDDHSPYIVLANALPNQDGANHGGSGVQSPIALRICNNLTPIFFYKGVATFNPSPPACHTLIY